MNNKTKRVKEYLEQGNSIDDMKAAQLCQTYRLSSIIYNLRHNYCLDVKDRWVTNENTGNRYKEYYLYNK